MVDDPVLARRLAAQLLFGPPAGGPLETTRHLLAIQAQDPRGARLAIRARTVGGHSSYVDRALNEDRSLVITWANRGTLHLVAADDEPLLHALTTPQLRKQADRRLGVEGIDAGMYERGIATIVRGLGDGPLVRDQIRERLDRVGVPTAGLAVAHVLFRATIDGLIVRGPMAGSEHAFVLAADWLGERPVIDRSAGLAELARRYLVGHGPATDRDLAKWAGLGLRDARAGLGAIASELEQRPDGLVALRRGVEAVAGRPETEPMRRRGFPPRLLGAFDPVLLGWASRQPILGEHERDVVTRNGIFRPIVLVGGRAVGIWSLASGRVALDLWSDGELEAPTVAALEVEAGAVEEYLKR